MERYLTFIVSIIVAIEITRASQKAITFLNKINSITDHDVERKIMVDKLFIELLPKIAVKYEEENETLTEGKEKS